jgi:hypothetical protein
MRSPNEGVILRGTNACFAYHCSGYDGVETFFIPGDPHATRFKRRIITRVIWPM